MTQPPSQPDHPRPRARPARGVGLRDLRRRRPSSASTCAAAPSSSTRAGRPRRCPRSRPRTSIARSRSSASASTRSASPSPRSPGSAPTRSRSSCPNVSSDSERAIEQIGTTAQLFLYDCEPNVIPPNPDIAEPGGAALQPPDRRGRGRVRSSLRCSRRAVPEAGLHDQRRHLLPVRHEHARADRRAVRAQGRPLPEPAGGERAAPNTQVIAVPRARWWSRTAARGRPDDRGRRRVRRAVAVLRPPRPPGPRRRRDHRPEAGRPTSSTSRPSTSTSPTRAARRSRGHRARSPRAAPTPALRPTAARHAPAIVVERRRRSFSGIFAIVLDGELVSNPIINFVENPAGIDGRTGAQISGAHAPRRPTTSPRC